jgi:hypothetical protein
MSNPEYCVFVSDELTFLSEHGTLLYHVLEVHCSNGVVGHIRVTSQAAGWYGQWPVWHYTIKDGRISLTGYGGHDSIKFLGLKGAEIAHPIVTNWELREK